MKIATERDRARWLEFVAAYHEQKARAEQLAEALRDCMEFLPDRGLPGIAKDKARAALEQENE